MPNKSRGFKKFLIKEDIHIHADSDLRITEKNSSPMTSNMKPVFALTAEGFDEKVKKK